MVNETHCYDICWEMREESNPEEVFTVNFACFILVCFFFFGFVNCVVGLYIQNDS